MRNFLFSLLLCFIISPFGRLQWFTFDILFIFGVPKRWEWEAKGSGVPTQTGTGRLLSPKRMNKLRVWVRQSGTELPVSSPWKDAGLNEVWKYRGFFPLHVCGKYIYLENFNSFELKIWVLLVKQFCFLRSSIINKSQKSQLSSFFHFRRIISSFLENPKPKCLRDRLKEKQEELLYLVH